MLKKSLKFLAGGVLVTILFAACSAAFEPLNPEEKIEYDADGRRLYTITIPTKKIDSRAITDAIARNNINFYEVVFKPTTGDRTYYSSATLDKPLKIRVPEGKYNAILLAGRRQVDSTGVAIDDGILLAADLTTKTADLTNGNITISASTSSTPVGFTLKAIALDASDLTLTGGGPITRQITADKYSYYTLPDNEAVSGVFATAQGAYGADFPGPSDGDSPDTCLWLKFGTPLVKVLPATYHDLPGFTLTPTSPAFEDEVTTPADYGKLTFTIPATTLEGLAELIFDVPLTAAFPATGTGITWHLTNGIDNFQLEKNTHGTPASNVEGTFGGGLLLVVNYATFDTIYGGSF
ncbi:hypothetical protein LQZ19_12220 [Treponema primitia]|uniref:hypothetical protein n=1 Tax=Treponema primitia TaxID=88058 RepID=UPI0039811889